MLNFQGYTRVGHQRKPLPAGKRILFPRISETFILSEILSCIFVNHFFKEGIQT